MKKNNTQTMIILVAVIGVVVMGMMVLFLGTSIKLPKGNTVIGTASVLSNDTITIESNQDEVQKFLDKNYPALSSTEKLAIQVKPILVNSNGKKIPLDASYFKVQSLFDRSGNLLDLGEIHFGFFAVLNRDDKVNLIGKYKVVFNDKVLQERDLYGTGNTINKVLQLESNGLKNFGFTFADEPESFFIPGVDSNILRVYITKVDATVGTNQDNSKRFFSDEEYPIFTMALSFDGDKKVIRDYKGEAISIFKNDSTLQSCGYAYLYRINVSQYGHGGESKQAYVYPPNVEIYVGTEKINTDSTPSPTTAPFAGEVSNGWRHGEFCTSIGNIPRDSTVKFVVEGKNFEIKTGKTQEIHSIKCSAVSTEGNGFPNGQKCSSTFGYSK